MADKILIKGARENNLQNVDVEIPRNKLVVITGVSGSGKSSLAFDTIYAEGRRRYMESLSSYARMFLGQMEKPDVDYIEGLSPAISIDQKTTSRSPRSTVGTVTEIYDYLRVMWARIGTPHCPKCGAEVKKQTVDQIVDAILAMEQGRRFYLLAPVISGKKGEHSKVIEDARKSGFVRVRIDDHIYELSEEIQLEKNKKHNIDIIVDRIAIREGINRRLTDSIESAMALSGGVAMLADAATQEEFIFSQNYACVNCGTSIPEVSPRLFSFNNPYGACSHCSGLGTEFFVDPDLILPDKSLSIAQGGICASGWDASGGNSIGRMYYEALGKKYGFSLNTPLSQISKDGIQAVLYGTKGEKLELVYEKANGRGVLNKEFEGIIPNLERRYKESDSANSKAAIEESMSVHICRSCKGARLNDIARSVTINNVSIVDFCELTVSDAIRCLKDMMQALSERELAIAGRLLKEVIARLTFLSDVGLGYLTLSRTAATLSGGESQRIRLASQIGSGLMGVLYILDEPSIGLHQKDNANLIQTMKHLRDMGNSVIVVEHDEDTMREADYIVDVGPGAGTYGGKILSAGTLEELLHCKESFTAKYLSGELKIEVPEHRRSGNGHTLTVRNARENNLKGIDVAFPLGVFTCVTGVSGSGKSSLVNEILAKILQSQKMRAKVKPGAHDSVEGLEYVDKVISLDQSPIGRTPRSNPATYTGIFNDIRELFAATKDAQIRGYTQGRFSFNTKGGRCEACSGDGLVKIEMHFLPDVFVPCEVCGGRRYNRETLEVRFKGKNISEVLDLTVREALIFFDNQPKIRDKIQILSDVGLDYLRLGQSSTTLSGGEAQRIKLATELIKKSTGSTVYILDEPSTGLHFADVHRLLNILDRLTDLGNTVIVIEHNLDIVKHADHIIDLGPDGGSKGGELVFAGTPEDCAKCEASYTGQYLKKLL
ncbi:MAG: excinuclease ABC subunit UvrA [Oscillospiraceae bacterium]|nr:excinuclease ABC subunit UvrA [Oscillospiraceae bacterium]